MAEHDFHFLKAAVGDRAQAVASWREVVELLELDAIKGVRERLLPLIYKNLSQYSFQGGEVPKLKGAYRFTWARNQLLISQFEEAMVTLNGKGLEIKAILDVSLVTGYLPDRGTRWIRAFAAEVDRVGEAASTLEQINWRLFGPPSSDERASLETENRITGATVHFHLVRLSESQSAPLGETLTTTLHKERIRIASPSEQLIQACMEGIHSDVKALLGPAADFLVVCKAATGRIDWGWVESQSDVLGCRAILHDLLDVAHEIYGRSLDDLP